MKRSVWLGMGSFLACMACVPDERPREQKASPSALPRPSGPFPGARAPLLPPALAPSGVGPATLAALPAPAADPLLSVPFTERFERTSLGADWAMTTAAWRLEGGRLCVDHAKNHPAWLRRRLPVNARIEFDATSSSEDGDLKAELWGDGRSAAETVSYTAATSYLTIFGGWKNQFHVLARIDEHAPSRPEVRIDPKSDDPRARRVEPNRTYRFKIVREDGRTVRWYVDDLEILEYPDPDPLVGPGHDHFGFNDWDVRACFDNLVVTPLR